MSVPLPSRSRFVQGRLLAAVLATGALLYSSVAPALGLGDITLRSSLNQPFRAEIELLDTAGLEEGDVRASLGTVEEFAKAGVDRGFFLNDLKFAPDFSGSRKVIRVSSSKAATEPYLSFVVQVARPNGQLLRTFTVLLDPPGLGPGLAERAPQTQAPAPTPVVTPAPQRAQAPAQASAPPPPATQGKRYEVARGDNLWSIGKRLEQAGTPMPVNELVRAIRVLNPDSAPLKAGQSLLLPDAAVLPGASAPVAAAPSSEASSPAGAALPAANEQPAAQLAATALENQQLQKNFDDLQARLQSLETQVADKDKQVGELQARLAETNPPSPPVTAPAAAPATAPAQPVPAPTPAPAPAPAASTETDEGNWLNLLAIVAVLLLVIALLLLVRRQRQRNANAFSLPLDPVLSKPAQAPVAATTLATAAVASQPAPAPSRVEPVVAARKETPPATDALDGASIYIAYGRYNEALGILREGVAKQPERTDLRLRMLEVLGQQGNAKGFAEQEAWLLAAGFSAAALLEVRSRYPAVAAAPAPAEAPTPEPVPASAAPQFDAEPELAAEPEFELDPLPGSDLRPEPVQDKDEFQLNLDDLSMDADWELVNAFDTAPAPKNKPAAPEPDLQDDAVDVSFASNLKEFPEVLEMPDEQFLSDFADAEDEPFLQLDEKSTDKTQDDIDNAFLDSFITDADLPELEGLTVDFDDLELQQASAQKLEDAQQHIDDGDLSTASHLLHELLREGDDSCKQAARQLLSKIG